MNAVTQPDSDLAIAPQMWLAENPELSNRQVFRHALARFADLDPQIVLLEADLAGRGDPFPARHAARFFNLGICEATMIDIACGMARLGHIVFAHSFASFGVMRACEQVRHGMAYGQANVKLICDYGGISGAYFGPTHHAIEDLAIIRAMPGMTVISPADGLETILATKAIVSHRGPVYMRFGRNRVSRLESRAGFEIGRANCLREGADVGIIAHGDVGVAVALSTAQHLEEKGLSSRVINMHTLKPLDEAAIEETAERTRLLVTVEEHNVLGGLGGAVCEVVSTLGLARRVVRLGLQDRYEATAGSHDYLLHGHGLDGTVAADKIATLMSPSTRKF